MDLSGRLHAGRPSSHSTCFEAMPGFESTGVIKVSVGKVR